MSKKTIMIIIGVIVVVAAIVIGIFVFTGTKKIETEELTREERDYTLSVNVPKEKGYQFVDELEEGSKYAPYYQDYILVGDKAEIYFEMSSFVYHTSTTLEEKYPEMDKENPNFADFLKYAYPDEEVIDFNGREAIKIAKKYGSAEDKKLAGYYYFVKAEDIIKGYLYITVLPKDENADVNAIMEDPEVKVILDSIKVVGKE